MKKPAIAVAVVGLIALAGFTLGKRKKTPTASMQVGPKAPIVSGETVVG